MKNKIIDTLNKRANEVYFDEKEHSYTHIVKGRTLTSVSETLAFFKTGMANVPEQAMRKAIDRGNWVHHFAEDYVNDLIKGKKLDLNNISKREGWLESYYPYAYNLVTYIEEQVADGWKPLATEQLLFNLSDNIAGTVDLMLYKEVGDNLHIKIVDYKTGGLRTSNYAQVGIYHSLLRKSLGRIKLAKTNVFITTELVSLVDLQTNK